MKIHRILISSRHSICVGLVSPGPGPWECDSVMTKNICSGQPRRNGRSIASISETTVAYMRNSSPKVDPMQELVLAKQQHYSVGEQMRRLLKLVATKPAEEITNQIEFL